MSIHVQVQAHMCAHVGSLRLVSGILLSFFYLVLCGGVSRSNSQFSCPANLVSQLDLKISCPRLLRLNLLAGCHAYQEFTWLWKSGICSWSLQGKCFNHWVISPAPIPSLEMDPSSGLDLLSRLQLCTGWFIWLPYKCLKLNSQMNKFSCMATNTASPSWMHLIVPPWTSLSGKKSESYLLSLFVACHVNCCTDICVIMQRYVVFVYVAEYLFNKMCCCFTLLAPDWSNKKLNDQ